MALPPDTIGPRLALFRDAHAVVVSVLVGAGNIRAPPSGACVLELHALAATLAYGDTPPDLARGSQQWAVTAYETGVSDLVVDTTIDDYALIQGADPADDTLSVHHAEMRRLVHMSRAMPITGATSHTEIDFLVFSEVFAYFFRDAQFVVLCPSWVYRRLPALLQTLREHVGAVLTQWRHDQGMPRSADDGDIPIPEVRISDAPDGGLTTEVEHLLSAKTPCALLTFGSQAFLGATFRALLARVRRNHSAVVVCLGVTGVAHTRPFAPPPHTRASKAIAWARGVVRAQQRSPLMARVVETITRDLESATKRRGRIPPPSPVKSLTTGMPSRIKRPHSVTGPVGGSANTSESSTPMKRMALDSPGPLADGPGPGLSDEDAVPPTANAPPVTFDLDLDLDFDLDTHDYFSALFDDAFKTDTATTKNTST